MARFLILFLLALVSDLWAENIPRNVRVGFYHRPGFQEMGAAGRSGYGYEFLRIIANNANWNYEYLGYDSTRDQTLDMLERGEVDLVFGVERTPENEKRFSFCEYIVAQDGWVLTVHKGNQHFQNQPWFLHKHIRVGVENKPAALNSLKQFVKDHELSFDLVPFDSEADVIRELVKDSIIDVAWTSALRRQDKEWPLSHYGWKNLYVAVKKNDRTMLFELNETLKRLYFLNNRSFQEILYKKNYAMAVGEKQSLAPIEKRYLDSLKNENVVLKAVMKPGAYPLSSFDEKGKASGYIKILADRISSEIGLGIEIVPTKNLQEYDSLLLSGSVDLQLDAPMNLYHSELFKMKLTPPYMDLHFSLLKNKKNPGTRKIAVPKASRMREEFVRNHFPQQEIVYFETEQECVDAVIAQKVDMTIQVTFSAEWVMNKDWKKQLEANTLPDMVVPLSLGIKSSTDPILKLIVEKVLGDASTDLLDTLINNNVQKEEETEEKVTLVKLLYDRPVEIFIANILFLLLFISLAFVIYAVRRNRRIESQKSEQERFLSYAMSVNDEVWGYDFERKTVTYYTIKDGVLSFNEEICERPYDHLSCRIHSADKERIDVLQSPYRLMDLVRRHRQEVFECRKRENGVFRMKRYSLLGVWMNKPRVRRLMCFSKDIDSIRRAELNQQQALREAIAVAEKASVAKGNFLSRVSHEIRTPLNAIIGYLRIARQKDTDSPKLEHCLKNADAASLHLLDLINNVLDMSSIESGKMQIAETTFNLLETLESLAEIFEVQADGKRVRFEVNTKGVAPRMVVGDALRLKQVLMNLLSNAIKFTPEGGLVTFKAEEKEQDGGLIYYQFTVTDTGRGMGEKFLQHLWQPFEQENPDIAATFGGTGLGLSISHNLVSLMNGTINVCSEEGKGTSFVVDLPLNVEGAGAVSDKMVKETSLARLKEMFKGSRLLLAEDNEMNREIACEILKVEGLLVDAVENGQEALEAFENSDAGTYTAILMDVQMPVMGGYQATMKIRASEHAEASSIPIFAMSANAFAEDAAKSLVVGMNEHLSKPFDAEKVFRALGKFAKPRHSA